MSSPSGSSWRGVDGSDGPSAAIGGPRLTRDLEADGRFVGRLVAEGPSVSQRAVVAALEALAVAVERILVVPPREGVSDSSGSDPRSGMAAELALSRLQQRSIVSLEPPDVAGLRPGQLLRAGARDRWRLLRAVPATSSGPAVGPRHRGRDRQGHRRGAADGVRATRRSTPPCRQQAGPPTRCAGRTGSWSRSCTRRCSSPRSSVDSTSHWAACRSRTPATSHRS